MKKVLITGASGFIGRQVTKQMLERGYTVYAPSIAPVPEEQEGVVQSKLDFFDREALRVLRLMPKWKPGEDHGQPCRTYICIPVVFKL